MHTGRRLEHMHVVLMGPAGVQGPVEPRAAVRGAHELNRWFRISLARRVSEEPEDGCGGRVVWLQLPVRGGDAPTVIIYLKHLSPAKTPRRS